MVLLSHASLPASVTLPRLAPTGTVKAQTHQCRTCPRATIPSVLAPALHLHGSRTHCRSEGTGKNVLYFSYPHSLRWHAPSTYFVIDSICLQPIGWFIKGSPKYPDIFTNHLPCFFVKTTSSLILSWYEVQGVHPAS